MRVWQPGSHLTQRRDAERVEDWPWQRTVRRISTLARLAAPYKLRTALALVSLLAATSTALAPPCLAKLGIDDSICKHNPHPLTSYVSSCHAAGIEILAPSLGT